MKPSYAIGIDYGTNSVRAIVVDCRNGKEIGASVFNYPSGSQGVLIDKKDPNLARQNTADYVQGLQTTVKGALRQASRNKAFKKDKVAGIGVDTTGSTPIPVDQNMVPLCEKSKWKNNLNACAWLWKDHTSAWEAKKITEQAQNLRPQYLAKCGGTYSSEWFWSKIFHCLNIAPDVFEDAHSWVELADYIPALLAGVDHPGHVVRGVCAAGHKAMYANQWGGLPDEEFLSSLDPKLATLRKRLFDRAHAAERPAGLLCDKWSKLLGLPARIPIAMGAFDAHYGAVGAGVAQGVMVKIMGTSTCDCMVHPKSEELPDIPGICGIVDGSILPGYFGLEAGQSAVGDIFKWFVEIVCKGKGSLHAKLTQEAQKQKPGQSGLLALDWNNGNRTILVNPNLTGLLVGQTLHTTQAEIYRALIEATAFGARAIIERIQEYGVDVAKIICCGGIAEKNDMLMQIYADVTGCEMLISSSPQTCALGSAVAAAVAAGVYESFEAAQSAMTSVKKKKFKPDTRNVAIYEKLYKLYRRLHDGFGGEVMQVDLRSVMQTLIDIRRAQAGG